MQRGSVFQRLDSSAWSAISIAIAYALLLGLLAIAAPSFYRGNQFRVILVGSAPVLVAAIGITLVILRATSIFRLARSFRSAVSRRACSRKQDCQCRLWCRR